MQLTEFSATDRFFIGVDPGQAVDPTAIAVTRVLTDRAMPVHQVIHLERLPLRTRYPAIVSAVANLLARPLLRSRCEVVVDFTGVGRPVSDLFVERGIAHTGVTITGGNAVAVETEPGFWSVPKVTLVSSVLTLLNADRLHIAEDLAEAKVLGAEFQAFHGNHTDTGAWRFGARAGSHDDLILALSLACWRAHDSRSIKTIRYLRGMSRQFFGGVWPIDPSPEPADAEDDLHPRPGELIVVVRERVWLHGKARYLEPGRQIMSEEDAAKLASLGYLE